MRSNSTYLQHLRVTGDRMLLVVIGGSLALSLALAPWHHTLDIALLIGLPAALLPAALVLMRPGALLTRSVIAACLMIFAALQIQQSHGMTEMHFSIFVMLAFLLVYRDWIPLLLAAALIAAHHLAFDAMQRAGLPVWVFASSGGPGMVAVHAAFVAFETALLVRISVQLRGEIEAVGCEPAALSAIARELARGNLSVDVDTRGASDGSLARAMDTMRSELASTLARERASTEENSRIRTALDRVTVGAVLADVDGKIIYVNECARRIFESSELRKRLPEVDPQHLVGTRCEALHPSFAEHRNLLSASTGSHTMDIRFGAAAVRITSDPVLDAGGKAIGIVMQWTDRTKKVAMEEELNTVVQKAIEGDLTVRADERGKDGFLKALSAGMNQLVANMADVVRTMAQAAAGVRNGAEEISKGNLNLSQRTEEQASSLQETAASMEQMTTAVKNNAQNAAQANQLALAAGLRAERGGEVVSTAVAAMREIEAASKKISDIIGVIDGIAFQTNLLALNAAVEAARAGEQGRGFAVVAAEVRNLASRSAEAANEIKALIHDSVGKVAEGTNLVNESGRVLGEIVTSVKTVTDVVAAIAHSSSEQAAGIDQVNKAVTSMDEGTQQNAALVEEASAAAHALSEQSAHLMQLIARYRVEEDSLPAAATGQRTAARRTGAERSAFRGERRGTNRPWSAVPTTPPPPASPGESDMSWKEF